MFSYHIRNHNGMITTYLGYHFDVTLNLRGGEEDERCFVAK